MMQGKPEDEQPERGRGFTDEQVRGLKIAALLIGLGVVLFLWWRRRGQATEPLLGTVLALVGAQAMASQDAEGIQSTLATMAKTQPRLTPTELWEALKVAGFHWDSPSHMGIQLARLGIRSQVRTVEGRAERRWYDLSSLTGPTEATAA